MSAIKEYPISPLSFKLGSSLIHCHYSLVSTKRDRYAIGLLLISPLGDLVRRRPLMLVLVFLTTTLSIGLCVTSNIAIFEALSFLVGIFSVVPQILIPLAADLSPPHRRASAISLVLAGLLCGILYARVVGGVIAEFVSWRVVYYVAIGIQTTVFVGMYFLLPDYPAKNPEMSYPGILISMGKLAVTEPILIQASLINIGSSACFSSFWVTLTFLLDGKPYNYSTFVLIRLPSIPCTDLTKVWALVFLVLSGSSVLQYHHL